MGGVRVVTDSTADIPPEMAAELGIAVIPCLVSFGEEVFQDRVELSPDAFFSRLQESGQMPTTSQPPPGAFEQVYLQLTEEGAEGIASIHLPRRLSGTYNSAWAAAQAVSERVPVRVLDCGNVAMALGWSAILAARRARRGASVEEVVQAAEETFPRLRVWAALDTLEFLRRGGRIGAAQALLGTMLQVKPLIVVQDGEVQPLERVRTARRALERLRQIAAEHAPFTELAILHTRHPQAAAELADSLAELHPRERMVIFEAGPVLATHAGPGALGLCAVLRS